MSSAAQHQLLLRLAGLTAWLLAVAGAPARTNAQQPLPSTPVAPLAAPVEASGGGVEDPLSDLSGGDLAAELRAQEEQVSGKKGGTPAYLTPAGDGRVAAVGGGGLGASRLMNPALSLIVESEVWYLSDRKLGLLRSAPSRRLAGYEIAEAEFGVEAAIDPYVYLKGYFVFGIDEFATEEVYVETLRLPGGLQARVGRMLASFGRTNPTHAHVWSFVDAPLPVQRFLSDSQLGHSAGELSYRLPLPVFVRIVASAGMPNVQAPGTHPDEATFGEWDDEDFLYLVRAETFVPLGDAWSVYLGASALTGPAGRPDDHSRLYGGDVFMRYKPVHGQSYAELNVLAEAMVRERDFGEQTVRDLGATAEVKLRFAKRWNVALRGDMVQGDLLRPGGAGAEFGDLAEERGSLSLAFVPSEFSLLRLQGNLGHPHGALWDGPDWVYEAFLKLSFSAGAHGAHPF